MGATALMTTDTYFSVPRVEAVCGSAARGLLLLVLPHICGVALASFRLRETWFEPWLQVRKRKAVQADIPCPCAYLFVRRVDG